MNKTTLHSWHTASGARMGAFAGYDMPLFYARGALKEHEFVRGDDQAGLFDISHMGQVRVRGAGTVAFLERVTPSVFGAQKIGAAKYSVLLNDDHKIVDDIIVTRFGADDFFVVINAGTKETDIKFLRAQLPNDVTLDIIEHDLIAVQGQGAARVVESVIRQSMDDLYFMQAQEVSDIIISRLGYTGEDGFELSVPRAKTADIWALLMAQAGVAPIGLAARDTLRLEMGYSLYGHDIDDARTPLDADLGFVCSAKNARTAQIPAPTMKRVGFRLNDKGIAREGAEIFVGDRRVSMLTSGGYSPMLKCGIGMGYMPIEYLTAQIIFIKVRENLIPVTLTNFPFVPSRVRRFT
jgi:aminomethyltransferase